MNKKIFAVGVMAGSLLLTSQVFAHTTVKPASLGIGKFQTFTVSAPTEKATPTIGIRLVLPEGLNHVSPNVKPGWKVEIKKEMVNGEEKITEINWIGGSIPAEMRDEFNFSAQAPNKPTVLAWKAYQTYQDGSIVAWDQDPSMLKDDHDFATTGPYSKTEVIDDLSTITPAAAPQPTNTTAIIAIGLSTASLLIALSALKHRSKAI